MAKPHRLKSIERDRGETLDFVLPRLVNTYGQLGAGLRLGISQASVSMWLKRNGYVRVTRWEKAS